MQFSVAPLSINVERMALEVLVQREMSDFMELIWGINTSLFEYIAQIMAM
jgi:hypothetical protein